MSAVAGSLAQAIPNPMGGFSPFPNSIMIPFMEAQSRALAFGFGIDYEYGKRYVKSMSNDTFNGLTPNDVNAICKSHGEAVLNSLQEQLPAYVNFMDTLIEQSVTIEKMKASRTPSAMAEILTAFFTGASGSLVDAVEQYTSNETEKSLALQTLTLISPILGLMGLLGEGGTTPPTDPKATELRNYIKTVSSQDSTIFVSTWFVMRNYEYDANKVEELKATKLQIINDLDAKYNSEWAGKDYSLTLEGGITFASRDEQKVIDHVKYIRTRDEYNLLNSLPA